ncbi:IS1634 family transposase [Alicyclobacillus sp. ALC3]|uniref:IS1634 family transposase n=1 Tax=Alicyclobacillus sp. ALC3 TaxID=2796143 RepID=UPI002379C2CE|nr:IS1634 family transposase [Alicyclobacillus sp. ALC3]
MIADMRHYIMGASAVWSRLIDRFGWVEMIDKLAARDDCKLSVGTRLKALLINIGTDRKALYKVQEFYEERDVEVLLGEGVSFADLNDDALGRALDILYDLDLDTVYPQIALATVKQLWIIEQFDDLLPVHADTTSLTLFGDYPEPNTSEQSDSNQDSFAIARGYSKAHRPDLKQIIFGLCTLKGVPLCANVDKGNQDDHTWNKENVPRLFNLLDEQTQEKLLYIADSAVVTRGNLELFAKDEIHFVSRLPSSVKLCADLKRAAWEKETAWQDIGQTAISSNASTYKIQSFRRELYGRTYRFIVVRSTGLTAQKEHKLEDVLGREKDTLTKAIEKASKAVYNCEGDARTAGEAFAHEHRKALHELKVSVVAQQVQEKRAHKGRPRKDEPAPGMHMEYRLAVDLVAPDEQVLREWREREETFVLLTDIRDDKRVSDEQVLRLYKDQIEVENGFKHLKSPYHVGPVFLHNQTRVKAFAYVMLLSQLLYDSFEYILREQMAKETEPLILPGKRKSMRPTGVSVLEMLETMQTVWLGDENGWQRMTARPHNDQIERVLGLLGFDLSIYNTVRKNG